MIQNFGGRVGKFLFYFLMIFVTHRAVAEISYRDMKGVHAVLSPEYDYLSPVYGFTLLATKTLENLRFYGNYGSKMEGLGCLEKASRIHELLVKNNDCPQDHTAELIQRLFPSQDGVNFVANQIDSDLVSHLTPELIGKVLGMLSQVHDEELKDLKRREKFSENLKKILFEGLHSKRVKELSKLIVESMQESRSSSLTYSSHLLEQALLAFFWKKGDQRQDFLRLFYGMAQLNPRILRKGDALHEFENQKSYLKSDVHLAELQSEAQENPGKVAEDFIRNPEKLALYAHEDALSVKPLPPIFSYGQARHLSLGEDVYPDCGETSLRNFLNIAIYNPTNGKFNIDFLRNQAQKNPQLHLYPNLIEFYQKHSDPALAMTQAPRNEWSEKVTSRHDGVTYLKPQEAPQCEITSQSSGGLGFDNMMKVLDRLLFNRDSSSLTHDRAQKLDELCQSLSREGFKLSWKVEGETQGKDREKINETKDHGISLVFSMNETPSFTWQFYPGHFVIQEIHQGKESWKDRVGVRVAQKMIQGEKPISPLFLSWFLSPWNLDLLIPYARLKNIVSLTYALPLASTDGKVFAFEKILETGLHSQYLLAQRLQAKLPTEDWEAQKRISIALANQDYPFPFAPPEKTFSGAVYQRVGDPEIVKRLGKSWKDSRGLIWGDVVKKEDGIPRKMHHSDAEAYCKFIGARLPTKEDFEKLAEEMGKGSQRGYIPQFLPHLYGLWFWSSSVDSSDAAYAHTFDGWFGCIGPSHRDENGGAARCVLPTR